MAVPNPQSAGARQKITEMLAPWQRALADPAAAQENVLQSLLAIYAQTGYGRKRGAEQVGSSDDFRAHFPIATMKTTSR